MTESVDSPAGGFWTEASDGAAAGQFRDLVNAVGDGLYRLDADGRIVGVNDALVALTGYDRQRLDGESVSTLLSDADRARIDRALADGETTVEVRVATADGGTVPCEIRVTRTEDGEVGVVRERDGEASEDRRTAPAAIGNVIDRADIAVFVLDDEFDVAWADETVGDYFGLDPEALVGRDKREVVTETMQHCIEDSERFAETVLATYDDNSYVEQFECRVTPGEGREGRWVEHYSKPIESGEYAGGRIEIYYDVTDRKESEGSLRDAEEEFESLVGAVEEYAIFRLDTDGTVLDWNEGAREIKGYDADEIVGRHFSAFYTEADREAGVPERNLDAARREGSIEDEGWRVREDGTEFWANVTINAVFDDDGTHRGFLKVTRDNERERELESELEQVLGRVSDAFYAVDEEFRFTHVNERAEQLLGYSAEELEDTIMWKVFPGSTGTGMYDRFQHAMDNQEPVSFERYFESLDLWAEVNVYPSETGLSVYLLDVTERKQREQELRATERRFDAVFQDPNILVGLLDPDGTVRDINETAMEYIEADLAAVRGEPFWETPWWGESDGARADAREWTQRAAAGEYVEFEADLVDPEGETYTISGFFRPVVDDEGEVVSIIVSDRDVTERKRRERQLAASEQRYRTLAEHFPNGVVTLFDDDMRYELAAGQAFDRLPHDPETMEGSHVTEVWPEEAYETVGPVFESALGGEAASVELPYAGREWILRAVPITDDDGEVFAAMTMAQDITERKERERYLEDVKSRLEAATEAGAIGTWEWQVQEDEMVVGESFAKRFGVDPEAAREGVPISRFVESIHEDDRDRVEAQIQRALETCGETESEYRVENADGEYRWVVTRGHVECEDGEPVRFPGALTDITERKRAELELQRNNEQLEALFDVLPVSVVVADADGSIVSANDTTDEILGVDISGSEEIREEERYSVYRAENGEPVPPSEAALSRVIDGSVVADPDVYEIDAADGERRIVEVKGRPIRGDDGEVTRGVVTMSEITERREYERRLEESNERLEQFAYAASHDLQEPLRMVSSYLQLIEDRYDDELDEEGREFLDFAVDGAERMKAMIDGLLAYSRVETRGNPLEPTDLNAVLADVRTDLQLRIEESGAEITAGDLPTVEGDEGQLRQVLQNLVENAIEYSGDESPTVEIDAEREGDRWRIDVTDEGIGIDADDQDRVFEVFQRLHTRNEHDGTGIGLALAKRIVERHGGGIRVASDPGEGATFSFTLPVVDGDE